MYRFIDLSDLVLLILLPYDETTTVAGRLAGGRRGYLSKACAWEILPTMALMVDA